MTLTEDIMLSRIKDKIPDVSDDMIREVYKLIYAEQLKRGLRL